MLPILLKAFGPLIGLAVRLGVLVAVVFAVAHVAGVL